jgi:Integrase core domain
LPRPFPARKTDDAAGFASRYGPLSCTPTPERSTLGFDAGISPDTASLLPGLLTATRTGLPPASDDELTKQNVNQTLRSTIPSLLDARITSYNERRLHSSLGYRTPAETRTSWQERMSMAAQAKGGD